MSRIGKKPVGIPSGVDVSVDGTTVTVKGPKGTLTQVVPAEVEITREGDDVVVTRPNDQPRVRAMHGLARSLLANMVTGVTEGYSRELEIVGVGYRATAKGKGIEILVGYSHPVEVNPPEGIEFEVPSNTRIVVRGIDKQKVGQVAADIRKIRKPEPYKGKGIRYAGEYVRRKAGKTGA
ncbi:MAG: 50S ribosomal protein L6 [Acidimicrobiia bacterium]|nr:50S ribosomal protein L6 [Acidimicrobiia bacterium]